MNDKDFVLSECPKTTRSPPPGSARPGSIRPRVLVADDDAGSRRFLGDGLRSLGAVVDTLADDQSALELARAETFDLLLLDCRMPGGGAMHILQQLRGDSQTSSAQSVAVATSADLTVADRRALLAAGFSDILSKPCTLADLRRVLDLVEADHGSCVLDDDAALYSSGDASTMHALRLLLRDELRVLQRDLDDLSQDLVAFADRLHRLRSSCGFCGVTALAQQVVLIQQQLSRDGATPAALASFRRAIQATLLALDG
ncbi:MAG: response regulator [Rhodanobacter sp.]